MLLWSGQFHMKKKLAACFLILVIFGAAGWFWFTRPPSHPGVLTLHGNIDVRQISIAFNATGRLLELHVEEGDHVKAGQYLGKLDIEDLLNQAAQAKAQELMQQQTALRLHNGSRPEEITETKARLTSAEISAQHADRELARRKALAANSQGSISEHDVDEARNEAATAHAKVDELRATARLTVIGPRQEDIAGADAQVKASQAQLALLTYRISQGELHAPADGVVRSRLQEPGDMVSPSKPVLALALTHPKWARIYVQEADLGKIRPGMSAQVSTDSYPGHPISGRIGYISSVAEFTPKPVETEELRTSLVYEVRVIVDDGADQLRLGQPVTVQVNTSP